MVTTHNRAMTKLRKSPKKKTSILTAWTNHWHKFTLGALVVVLVGSLFTFVPQTHSATAAGLASATDTVASPYGSIGKWMLKSNGQISDWGGKKYQKKTLYEVVNLVIVDPTSTTASASTKKINSAMSKAGFPSKFGHSIGFKGRINDSVYGQQPTGLNAFSDKSFLAQNNHGRLFGAAPIQGGGYVWTGGLSTEKPTYFLGILTGHSYVSFNTARDAVASGFVKSGQTQSPSIDMGNVINTNEVSTGDHDGKAVVITLK